MLIANEIFYAILNRCLPTCSFYCSYPCRSSAERVQHSTHKKGPHTAFIPELPKTCPFPWPLPDPDSEEDTAFAIGTQTNATDLLLANSITAASAGGCSQCPVEGSFLCHQRWFLAALRFP